MPDVYEHADAVRVHLTGAASDNAAQSNPNLSLGKFRSSSLVSFLGNTRTNAIANITVDFIAGANGTGAGTITASGASELKWTPPGGTQGAGVTIANGETKVLEAGNGEYEKYVVVSRTSADALAGTETDTLADMFNSALGFDNVSSVEAGAGDDEYRCICLKVISPTQVDNIFVYIGTLGSQFVSDTAQLGAAGAGTIAIGTGSFDTGKWPDTGWCRVEEADGTEREAVYYSSRTATILTVPAAGRARLGTGAAAGAATDKIYPVPGIAIGKEAPSSQPTGSFEDETGDEDVPPGAVGAWKSGIREATGLNIGDLAAGYIYGIWIWREMPASTVAESSVYNYIIWSFDAV